MEWRSVLSEHADSSEALRECVRKTREHRETPPDLAFLFPSAHHARNGVKLAGALSAKLSPQHTAGCTGGGVIGDGREVEARPALSLVSAWLPGVEVRTFRLEQERMPDADAPPGRWREWTGVKEQPSGLVLLCDPFSMDVESLLRGLDYAYPKAVKIGGLSSGAGAPGGNVLFGGKESFTRGAAGVALSGDIVIDPIVAQGCRPVGSPQKVTRCHRNLILELNGYPATEALSNLLDGLDEEDGMLARTSLLIGLVGDVTKSSDAEPGYLIRNILGLDPESGALAVGALMRRGQSIRFHVRDKHAASADLDKHLSDYQRKRRPTKAAGALLFSCLGRGENLYKCPDHDTSLFRGKLGKIAMGGFFCGGEIGPIDGSTFLHGHTSCFGVFRRKKA